MGMGVPTCNLGLEKWKQEDKKFNIILDYIVSLRPTRALEQPVFKKIKIKVF